MIKDFLLTRAGHHVTTGELQHYLETVHAPLALSAPALARETRRYTMNHATAEPSLKSQIYPSIPNLATVVEHLFGGWEGIKRFSADADYLARVRPDEEYMASTLMVGAPQFIAIEEERPIFRSGQRERTRLFDFVRRPASISRSSFLQRLSSDGERAEADAGYRAAVSQRVHSIVGEGTASFGSDAEPFDAVIEIWIKDSEKFDRIVDQERSRRNEYSDPARSFSALTQEHWLSGSLDAFGESGNAFLPSSSDADRHSRP